MSLTNDPLYIAWKQLAAAQVCGGLHITANTPDDAVIIESGVCPAALVANWRAGALRRSTNLEGVWVDVCDIANLLHINNGEKQRLEHLLHAQHAPGLTVRYATGKRAANLPQLHRKPVSAVTYQSTPDWQAFLLWLRGQGGVWLGDECYPDTFELAGHTYRWWTSTQHRKGTSMAMYDALWGEGGSLPSTRYATGALTRGKVFRFYRAVYQAVFDSSSYLLTH